MTVIIARPIWCAAINFNLSLVFMLIAEAKAGIFVCTTRVTVANQASCSGITSTGRTTCIAL